MLITKRTYNKKYAIGDAGIFDSIGKCFSSMFSNSAAKQLASAALQVGKTTAKDIGMKAIDVGKQLQLMLVRNKLKRLLKVIHTQITSG